MDKHFPIEAWRKERVAFDASIADSQGTDAIAMWTQEVKL